MPTRQEISYTLTNIWLKALTTVFLILSISRFLLMKLIPDLPFNIRLILLLDADKTRKFVFADKYLVEGINNGFLAYLCHYDQELLADKHLQNQIVTVL